MNFNRRYKYIYGMMKRIFVFLLVAALLAGCKGKSSHDEADVISEEAGSGNEDYRDAFVDIMERNSDAFAWIKIPDTEIDYPILQSQEGDDDFYKTHNAYGQEDPKGALYIECANLKDMCDFNEVVHGSSIDENSMFGPLQKFLDRKYFESHEYIYVYLEGNALVYDIMAAFSRDDTRLLEQYDFSYAYGCQEFIDEIYDGRSMTKNIRQGWEEGLSPEHFLITLSTQDPNNPGKQIVVIGCLVGDIAGKIDRVVDYTEPDELY